MRNFLPFDLAEATIVASLVGVSGGLLSSALFSIDYVLADTTVSATDLFTVRIGAIVSLLVAGAGVITAVGGQIQGFFRLYVEQRKNDFNQESRYEDLVRRLQESLKKSEAMEAELIKHKVMIMRTMTETTGQLGEVKKMLNSQTHEIKEDIREQVKQTKQGIADATAFVMD